MVEAPRKRVRRRVRRERTVTFALKILATIALSGLILGAAGQFIARIPVVVTVIIGAVFFAYVIYPVVRRLSEKMPLGAAITIVYAALLGLIVLFFSIVVPPLTDEGRQLANDSPMLVAQARDAIENPRDPVIRRLPEPVRTYLAKIPENVETAVKRDGGGYASKAVNVVLSTVSVAAFFIIIPVVTAYMLFEAEAIKHNFVGAIPRKARRRTLKIVSELDDVVGGFVRGQLIVAAIIGTLITIMLFIFGVKYALLIGFMAGILDIVPYVGAVAGWLPAFLIAIFTLGWQKALFVSIGFAAINQLEGHFIAPRVVSSSVGLTPLGVIIALLIGGELFGTAGLLVAVPIAGMLRVLIMNALPEPPPEPRATAP